AKIEALIKARIGSYSYGSRREDQAPILAASGTFGGRQFVETRFVHRMPVSACLEAWKSHATLRRQAGEQFESILADLKLILEDEQRPILEIPYLTRMWVASKKSQ